MDYPKNHYDSEEVWHLKRLFVEKHKHHMAEDRLHCLAQLMVNQEVLGCRYQEALRSQIEELAGDILRPFREAHRNRYKRVFVSASDAAQGYVQSEEQVQVSSIPIINASINFRIKDWGT